ncbi:hypothetical protein GCM10023068_35290 [Leifsonia shinshuensis]
MMASRSSGITYQAGEVVTRSATYDGDRCPNALAVKAPKKAVANRPTKMPAQVATATWRSVNRYGLIRRA